MTEDGSLDKKQKEFQLRLEMVLFKKCILLLLLEMKMEVFAMVSVENNSEE